MNQKIPEIVLYSRSGCHLCDIAERVLQEETAKWGWTYRKMDVDTSEDLRNRFGEDVPVVAIEGRPAFKHRLNAQALHAFLTDRVEHG